METDVNDPTIKKLLLSPARNADNLQPTPPLTVKFSFLIKFDKMMFKHELSTAEYSQIQCIDEQSSSIDDSCGSCCQQRKGDSRTYVTVMV